MFIAPTVPDILLSPENIISDPKSRELWVSTCGSGNYMMTYETFSKNLLPRLLNTTDKKAKKLKIMIKFFFKFPREWICYYVWVPLL